jgi:hypothetical protein
MITFDNLDKIMINEITTTDLLIHECLDVLGEKIAVEAHASSTSTTTCELTVDVELEGVMTSTSTTTADLTVED